MMVACLDYLILSLSSRSKTTNYSILLCRLCLDFNFWLIASSFYIWSEDYLNIQSVTSPLSASGFLVWKVLSSVS